MRNFGHEIWAELKFEKYKMGQNQGFDNSKGQNQTKS